MIVLVCGGRNFGEQSPDYRQMSVEEKIADTERVNRQRDLVKRTLDDLWDEYSDVAVIHGAAKGADRIAGEWAVVNSLPVEKYPAQWDMYGKRAGMLRNLQMIVEGKPDVVVAFPGGNGTANMVNQAHAHRIRVIEVKDADQ